MQLQGQLNLFTCIIRLHGNCAGTLTSVNYNLRCHVPVFFSDVQNEETTQQSRGQSQKKQWGRPLLLGTLSMNMPGFCCRSNRRQCWYILYDQITRWIEMKSTFWCYQWNITCMHGLHANIKQTQKKIRETRLVQMNKKYSEQALRSHYIFGFRFVSLVFWIKHKSLSLWGSYCGFWCNHKQANLQSRECGIGNTAYLVA